MPLILLKSLLGFIAITLTIFVVVGVHELGHFIFARWMGIPVLRFSLGFGKPLWQFTSRQGTVYQVGRIPLGGYVKLLDEREGPVPAHLLAISYMHQPIWKRLSVVLAGPLFNLLFSLLAFWLMLMIGVVEIKPIVTKVLPNSPFSAAGFSAGQQIMAVDHQATKDWQAVTMQFIFRLGDKGLMQVEAEPTSTKGIKRYEIPLKEWRFDPLKPKLLDSLGLVTNLDEYKGKVMPTHRYGPLSAMTQSAKHFYLFTKLNVVLIYKLLIGKISFSALAGPISFAESAILTFQQGVAQFLKFLGFMSIAVGIINLIPIPGLDGAHLVYLLLEKWRGKPVSVALQLLFYRFGIILLSIIFIQVMLNDLLRVLG